MRVFYLHIKTNKKHDSNTTDQKPLTNQKTDSIFNHWL